MSDSQNFGFGKFVPGFDFLQGLAKGASQGLPQLPSLSNWVAPTLSVEEIEKRISELKAVHFWLDQNSKALGATIQALEVQKMTLATLKGMNVAMGDIANAMKLKPEAMGMQSGKAPAAPDPAASAGGADTPAPAKAKGAKGSKSAKPAGAPGSVVDPVQWWGALTQQFQEIANDALKDAARQAAAGTAGAVAAGAAKGAMKMATGVADAMSASVSGGARKLAAARSARKGSGATGGKKAPARRRTG